MTTDDRPSGAFSRGRPAVVPVALAGILALGLLWNAATSARLRPASSRASRQGAGGGSGGSSTRLVRAVSRSTIAKVDPAVVDIDTLLGLEGAKAAGTGMVVTSNGLVITNDHVIAGATTISATDVGNGRTYRASVVGYDHSHDVAVLQLEGASGLRTVRFGDSRTLKVGQRIAAVGNAGGTGGTPTAARGRITALRRSITAGVELVGASEHLTGLIQLNAHLRPGDSGGPLVDAAGDVVGMNTAASTSFRYASSASAGFAIPSAAVRRIARQIDGGVSSSAVHIGATGMLGVLVRSGGGRGARVERVFSGSPAAGGGLTAGDTITALDGRSVRTPSALTELLLRKHPGDTVTIAWQTPAGAQQAATVVLASGPPA